jgi:hypothetical protein
LPVLPRPKAARRRRSVSEQVASAAGGAVLRILHWSSDFLGRVYHKAGQDDIFFLAGAIAFNVLIAAVPFLLLLIAVFGFVLPVTVEDPEAGRRRLRPLLPARFAERRRVHADDRR